MPAIRDFAVNYSSTTTNPILCSAPDTLQNDLLIALASVDVNGGSHYWVGGEACTTAFLALTGGTVYTNYTTAFNNTSASDFWLTNTTSVLNDAFYVGHTEPFNGVSIQHTAGSSSAVWTWEYWNGTAWVTLTTLGNSLVAGSSIPSAGVHQLNFNPPGDWATTTVNAVANTYWVRMRCSTAGTLTTRVTCTQGWIGRWNQLFSAQNTTASHHAILFKMAGAAEPEDYAIHGHIALNDTQNAMIVSIRDVDTTFPLVHETIAAMSYASTNQDSNLALYTGALVGAAQSFTSPAAAGAATTSVRLASAKFYLKKVGAPTGNITVKLNTQTAGVIPTTPLLAVSNTYNIANLTTSYQMIEFTFPWYAQYLMAPSTVYVISVEYAGGDASNYLHVGYDNSASSGSGNGSDKTGTTWTARTYDLCYGVYYWAYNTSTSTAVRAALPQVTTERDNSLAIYSISDGGAVVPSILEGPVTFLAGKDGSSHSDGMSWGFVKTAGSTPNNVYATSLGTAWTKAMSTIVVNPPSGGATVIPPYCASDASVYISPSTGAAYATDAAPAVTATTYFGSSLNGKTLVSSGTTITYADTGINSYHAMRNVAGVVTAKTWSGNVAVMASRDLSGKNILFHIQPYVPLSIQTTDSVSLDGACGVAIGFASLANTNYKVWHVGGANTPFGVARHQPVVINTGYTGAGMIQNTGTLNAAAVVDLGFFVSGKVVLPNWLMGSIWALDTTAVCGGNSTEPLDISGIIKAAADGHERRSVTSQGSGQMMIFQPLQIGDGGTNPVYLKLESTATEFPKQYDKASKTVNYCSIDNVAGLKYYGGASDTIIHKDSILSSPSRYHWGLHASHSTSCTPDFSGLSVIGAGTITLARAITITQLTINNYSTIDATGLTLTYSDILNVPNTNDSITLTAASNIDYCSINTTGLVTAGNRWCSVADPTIFTYCTFTGSASTGHAIRITTPGTYALVGNIFNSYGASGTNSTAIFNDSGGLVTLNISAGGNSPTYKNGTNASTVVNNNVTLTISANVTLNGAEVRIYDLDGSGGSLGTELSGAETHNAATYAYSGSASNSIWIQIMKDGYVEFGQQTTMPTVDGNFTATLLVDTNI